MKLPCLFQFRILKLAIQSLFSRPFTTRFPAEPYEPIPQYRGRPRYNKEECIGCGACSQVCPSGCIDLTDEPRAAVPVRRLVQHLDQCIQCGQCERYCTSEKGIKLTTEYDYVGFKREDFEEKVEKELLLCEHCGDVIAPKDQLRWLVNRLGPLSFANPTLMLTNHDRLEVVGEGVAPETATAVRAHRVSIQCPKCRRASALVA